MSYLNAEERLRAAADLRASAGLIERNGWYQGNYYKRTEGQRPENCKLCALGAIRVGVSGSVWGQLDGWGRVHAANYALQEFIGNRDIPAWNDREGQTAEAVVKAMRDCADALEAQAA